MRRLNLSLRGRLTVVAAVAVALTAVAVCTFAWLVLKQSVVDQADKELQTISLGPVVRLDPRSLKTSGDAALTDPGQLFLQVIQPNGKVIAPPQQATSLPITAADRRVLTGAETHVRYTAEVPSGRFRVLTIKQGETAVQLARSLRDADASANRLGLIMILVAGAAIVVAAVVGRLVARIGLRPIDHLTSAAEEVAATQDLQKPIAVVGGDEVARLGEAFNRMLSALDGSRQAQRRLVDDVAHELRTPMTSLRANVELLLRARDRLPESDRSALLGDLRTQSLELSNLVTELVGLGRLEAAPDPVGSLDLGEVVKAAVVRVQAHRSSIEVRYSAGSLWLDGRAAALERMTLNLIDNAAKFSPPHGTVEVVLGTRGAGRYRRAELVVADRGPGIAEAERERVFERFYRTTSARTAPGSGLGLAIVRQIVDAHGGVIHLEPREGGGTVARVWLPFSQEPAAAVAPVSPVPVAPTPAPARLAAHPAWPSHAARALPRAGGSAHGKRRR